MQRKSKAAPYEYVKNRPLFYIDPYGLGWAPTYGNWGGDGWSGGEKVDEPNKTKWNVGPVNDMDLCFRNHDWVYQKAKTRRQKDEKDCKDNITDKEDLECCMKHAKYREDQAIQQGDCAVKKCLDNLPNDPKQWTQYDPNYKLDVPASQNYRFSARRIFGGKCAVKPKSPDCCPPLPFFDTDLDASSDPNATTPPSWIGFNALPLPDAGASAIPTGVSPSK